MLRIKNVGLIMVAIILFLTPTIVFGASGYSSQSIKRVVVTFDAQEGNVSQTSKSVILNSTYGNLPVPTRNGYIFGGWYTGKSGSGTMILSATLVTNASNHTLYAKWVNNISSGGNGYSSLPNNPSSGESQGLKVFFNDDFTNGYRVTGTYTNILTGLNETMVRKIVPNCTYNLTHSLSGGKLSVNIRP